MQTQCFMIPITTIYSAGTLTKQCTNHNEQTTINLIIHCLLHKSQIIIAVVLHHIVRTHAQNKHIHAVSVQLHWRWNGAGAVVHYLPTHHMGMSVDWVPPIAPIALSPYIPFNNAVSLSSEHALPFIWNPLKINAKHRFGAYRGKVARAYSPQTLDSCKVDPTKPQV